MPRILAAILLVAVLAIGGGLIATTAYQAGLSTAVTTAAGSGGRRRPGRRPAYGYGYGYGWHPASASGSSASSATLFFLFIVFGLLRAIFWRGGPGRRGGWGAGGWGGSARTARRSAATVRGSPRGNEAFDEWHRRAHGETPPPTRHADGLRPSRPAPPRLDGPPPLFPRPRTISSGGASRSTMPPMKTILVVDDEPKIATLARDYLEHAGFAVLTAGDGAVRARDRSASGGPTWSSSTSACPASTASTSPASCGATRRSRS